MIRNPNAHILEQIDAALGSLATKVVYVGGCAAGLLVTDAAASPIRPTVDVDVLVEVATLSAYHSVQKTLRTAGFAEDQDENAPICRWRYGALILDVMPTDASILGFGNRWYSIAFKNSSDVDLGNGRSIRLITAPYFLATKLDAFEDRGNADYLASHDMEDIIVVVDGRATTVNEIASAADDVRTFLSQRFSQLLASRTFVDAISAHLPPDAASQARKGIVLKRLSEIAQLA
jgi:hypothetical protein